MKIQISLSKPGLYLNKEMYRQARGNKHAGTIIMSPVDFLNLAAVDEAHKQEIMNEARTLEEYNAYIKSGKAIHMPWLYITLDGIIYPDKTPGFPKGKVIGHEGRHRAAALIKAGVKKMPVSLRIYVKGIERPKKYTPDDPWSKEPWAQEDIPIVFHGEYNKRASARIDQHTFKAY